MNICFNKQPFELDFNKFFYTENSNKINEIKDVVLVLDNTGNAGNVVRHSRESRQTFRECC